MISSCERSGPPRRVPVYRLTGFFASLLLMFVALTGAYFAFPKTYEAIVAWRAHKLSVLFAPRTRSMRRAVQAMPAGETSLFAFPQQKDAAYSLRRLPPEDWKTTADFTSILGLSSALPAILSVTGLLMWWNRSRSHARVRYLATKLSPPDTPERTIFPSLERMLVAFPWLAKSFERQPFTTTSSPTLSEYLVQPARSSALGLPNSNSQLVISPESPFTSR